MLLQVIFSMAQSRSSLCGWQAPYWNLLGNFSKCYFFVFLPSFFLVLENKENKWVLSLSCVGRNFSLRAAIADSNVPASGLLH